MTEDQKHWEQVLEMGQRFAEDIETVQDLHQAAQEEDDYESMEALEESQRERPLSVEIRSGWYLPGNKPEPDQYRILLGTGGPAMQITGQLDCYGQPCTAAVEVQDWFKPWTEITTTTPAQDAALLWFASLFYYGGGE